MDLAVGNIVTGKVTTITKFGAFIALPEGKSGLVHISEVAPTFVSDVHDFLAEGQEVTVKILAITPEGKINLSIKQAMPRPQRPGRREAPARRTAPTPAAPPEPAEQTFEDKLKQFMSVSDSKQSELNRYIAGKRGGRRRKKSKLPARCMYRAGSFFCVYTGLWLTLRTLPLPGSKIRQRRGWSAPLPPSEPGGPWPGSRMPGCRREFPFPGAPGLRRR